MPAVRDTEMDNISPALKELRVQTERHSKKENLKTKCFVLAYALEWRRLPGTSQKMFRTGTGIQESDSKVGALFY